MGNKYKEADMKCGRADSLLIRYIENDLKVAQRSDLERHIESCAECRSELAALKGVLELGKSCEIPSVDNSYWQTYVSRFWQKAEGMIPVYGPAPQKRIAVRTVFMRWAIPACAAALLLIVSFHSQIPVKKNITQAKDETVKESVARQSGTGEKEREFILAALAEGAEDIYEPSLDTTEMIEEVYDKAMLLEQAIEQEEGDDCMAMIETLSDEEKEMLTAKIKAFL